MLPDVRLDIGDAFLRPLQAADVTQSYVDGLNDPEVHRWLTGPRAARQTLDAVRAYVLANAASEHDVLFGLFVDEALCGTLRLHRVVAQTSRSFVGMVVFERSMWGAGWGRRMLAAVQEYAVGLGISELFAGIEIGNVASERCFGNAGFRLHDRAWHADPPASLWRWEAT